VGAIPDGEGLDNLILADLWQMMLPFWQNINYKVF